MVRGNIIKKFKKNLFHLLKCDVLPKKTYLAGGTAVYFYLKHRISVDLDFFTPSEFNPEIFIYNIKKCFKDVQVELMEKNSVILYISKEKIKFSLFHFPYPLLSKENLYKLENRIECPMASMEDIEAMKAIAITQRGSAKDFVDLFYLLQKTKHTFGDILGFVLKKFELKKNYEYQLKTSFVFFDDAEAEIKSIMMVSEDGDNSSITTKEWEKMKKFFNEFIK